MVCCVCDHGLERSNLYAEIIIIIIQPKAEHSSAKKVLHIESALYAISPLTTISAQNSRRKINLNPQTVETPGISRREPAGYGLDFPCSTS